MSEFPELYDTTLRLHGDYGQKDVFSSSSGMGASGVEFHLWKLCGATVAFTMASTFAGFIPIAQWWIVHCSKASKHILKQAPVL